jgi:hypothetical protein
MSKVEQTTNEAAIQRLWEEIGRIKELQAAAEKMAALMGMTTDESMQYKERHGRIKELTKELVTLGSQSQAATHEQKEAKEITRHGRKGAQIHCSKRTRKSANQC